MAKLVNKYRTWRNALLPTNLRHEAGERDVGDV